MNTQTLNGVTLKTLDNYRAAATQAMVAYRLGGHKLVSAVNHVLANSVYPRTAAVAPQATVRMNEVRESISGIVVKGIDGIADRTVQAIESGSSTAAAQLKKVSGFATGIQHPVVANGLQTAARLTLPSANVALALSSKVAQGAQALAGAAGARPARKAARKAAPGVKRKAGKRAA
jgi:hypothetical protein